MHPSYTAKFPALFGCNAFCQKAPGSAGKFCRAGKRREVLIYFDASRQIYHFVTKRRERREVQIAPKKRRELGCA